MAQETDPRNVFKIILPHPTHGNQTQTVSFTFKPALIVRGPVVRPFFCSSPLLEAEYTCSDRRSFYCPPRTSHLQTFAP